MKKLLKIENSGLLMIVVMLVCALFGVSGAIAADTVVVDPVPNTVTVTDTRDDSPNLILDTIDKEVAKIRPHNVVLDTISRHVKSVKSSTGQVVRHYAIDAIELTTTVATAYTETTATQAALDLVDGSIISNDETLICVGVSGYMEGTTNVDADNDLILYVKGKNDAGQPVVVALNGKGSTGIIPTIAKDTVIMRAGRALSETQIQTDAYNGVPTDFVQYLQKFGCQIEESTLMKLADKEVGWTFSDQEEEALYDMRRTQNVTFWKGVKKKVRIKNSRSEKAEDIYFTQGIWMQAGKEIALGATATSLDAKDLTKLMKHAFTGNESGKKKLIIMGSDFLEAVENVDWTKNVKLGEKSVAFGLEFDSIISRFGTLLGVHDKTLDDMNMADKAFILDADFLRKWTMGWKAKDLDKKSSGESDVDARTMQEICGLILKNPKAHSRVALGSF